MLFDVNTKVMRQVAAKAAATISSVCENGSMELVGSGAVNALTTLMMRGIALEPVTHALLNCAAERSGARQLLRRTNIVYEIVKLADSESVESGISENALWICANISSADDAAVQLLIDAGVTNAAERALKRHFPPPSAAVALLVRVLSSSDKRQCFMTLMSRQTSPI